MLRVLALNVPTEIDPADKWKRLEDSFLCVMYVIPKTFPFAL